MRVPIEWLKEYVAIRMKPEQLARRLTMAGLEVTGIATVDGQPVFELEITPNRADCLSIIGIAREVAAITGQRLKPPEVGSQKSEVRRTKKRSQFTLPPAPFHLRIEDRKGCRRYIGRVITGVKIAPSPSWMQRRLIACGIRPINNVVDITNYVLLEYGQPLHAFDYAQLAQGAIIVRRAKDKELLTTLDGIQRTLTAAMLVIADSTRAVAVAGVMGGVGSEVTPQTTNILLESAEFDPITVRRTARALGLSSESSYRFERGIDPSGVEAASARASAFMGQLAGGVERAVRDAGIQPTARPAIVVDSGRASRWLGLRLSPTEIRSTLARLSCHVASAEGSGVLRVIPPSFRRDVMSEVDCFEELARLMGYERIPATLPTSPLPAARGNRRTLYSHVQSIRCLCASFGLVEAINWSLVSEAELSRCGFSVGEAVRLSNPISQDHAWVRPSLMIGLLRTIRRNLSQGAEGVQVFEIGHLLRPASTPEEHVALGIALTGVWSRDWRTQERCDFFKLKGLAELLMQRVCRGHPTFRSADLGWAESGEAATILLQDRSVGVIGKLARRVAMAWDLEHEVWLAELDVTSLLEARRGLERVAALTPFPPVKRDLSLLVNRTVAFEQVAATIRESGSPLAQRVMLIDRYTGKQLPANTYSLTFSIDYRDPRKTLTADEVDAIHGRIGRALVERLGAQLR